MAIRNPQGAAQAFFRCDFRLAKDDLDLRGCILQSQATVDTVESLILGIV